MSYHFSKTLKSDMDTAISQVTDALTSEGFGILTEIDVQKTLKNKINVDFRPYRILGACNPGFAHKALMAEDKIGAMLPCNVIVQQVDSEHVEVSAVDPAASMSAVTNPALEAIASDVRTRLQRVVAAL